MPEQTPLISKIILPLSILLLFFGSALCAYFGWIDTAWSTAPFEILGYKVVAAGLAATGLFIVIGHFAQRAGWTREELDKWGDDMMAGKPPI